MAKKEKTSRNVKGSLLGRHYQHATKAHIKHPTLYSKPKKKVKVRSGSNPPTIKKLYEPKKTKKGKDIYKRKAKIKSGRIPKKKTKKKEAYLIDLKREKNMAEKGWKVARTKTYLELPKKAIGKKGYPYAVLNKNNTYESFYTWKEKTTKKR